MNIGATEQEVQESKKQDLTKPDRRYPTRRKEETDKTIYYYQTGNRKLDQRYYSDDIYVPIENYSANLIRQLDLYLNKIKRDFDVDTVESLITLRSVIFPKVEGLYNTPFRYLFVQNSFRLLLIRQIWDCPL